MKCEECGTTLPCVNTQNHLCKECDEQYEFCYLKCKNPCRRKDEQERMLDRIKPEWRNNLVNK